MSIFNFAAVERKKAFGTTAGLPEGIVRVGPKTIGVSQEAANNFHSSRYQTRSGDSKVRLGLFVDPIQQAIKLSADDGGFSFSLTPTGSAFGTVPTMFKRAGLPTGDYVPVEGEHGVYQLAR